MGRATKGGQIGMNGEYYNGGQFLPNTTLPKGAPTAKQIESAERKAKQEAERIARIQTRQIAYEQYKNDSRLETVRAKYIANVGSEMPIEYQMEHAYGLKIQDERN